MRIVNRLIEPTSGRIVVEARTLRAPTRRAAPPHRYVIQQVGLSRT